MTHPSAPADPLILAFGDSLIAGYGLAPAEAFPARLQTRLGQGVQVIPAGRSGDTTDDALRRLPRVLAALTRRPDLAIIQIGANDVLRGIPPAQMRVRLDRILNEFNRCGIPVLLTTIDPPASLAHRTQGYAQIHADCARRYGAATCGFFPPGVLGHPALTLADRVHPNAAAIARVVDHILPSVEAVLRPEKRTAA